MIIDAHTHPYTWPFEQGRSSQELKQLWVRARFEGYSSPLFRQDPIDLSDSLIEDMDRNNIDKAIVNSTMQHTPNSFISELVKRHPNRLIGFGKWIYPAKGEEAARQVEEAIRKFGMKGIGEVALIEMYPIPPDQVHRAPELCLIMDKIAELNVPILFHTGWFVATWPLQYCDPLVVDNIADVYPEVKIIIGHAGRFSFFHEAALMAAMKHDKVYLELSNQQSHKDIESMVKTVGAEKCIFGTDWPYAAGYIPSREEIYKGHQKALYEAEITEREREQILGKNMIEILRL